mmetsp:Transcript_133538/g.266432  ORF Transcript_133538/g.266432 Transcript_133538/m.266432 type:complete len:186 (+) Transcript_133538:28-585(+)
MDISSESNDPSEACSDGDVSVLGDEMSRVYIISEAHRKFLDTHGKDVWVWSRHSLLDTGRCPDNLRWRLHAVEGKPDTYYVINEGHEKNLNTNGMNVHVSAEWYSDCRCPNLHWRLYAVDGRPDTYYFLNEGQQMYLDTHGWRVNLWRGSSLWDLGGRPENLQWRLVPASHELGLVCSQLESLGM